MKFFSKYNIKIIIQPVKREYTPFTTHLLLKWKPPELNSLDFLIKCGVDAGFGKVPRKFAMLFVTSHGQLMPFCEMKYSKDLEEYNNQIIECSWDPKLSGWHFMRVRTDKSNPNHISVANNVIESIKNPVHEHFLLDFIEKHAYKPSAGKSQKRDISSLTSNHQSHSSNYHQHNNNNNNLINDASPQKIANYQTVHRGN